MSFTDGELLTIHRLCDYIISRRLHFFNIAASASGKDDIVSKAKRLDEKVSQILWPKQEDIEHEHQHEHKYEPLNLLENVEK